MKQVRSLCLLLAIVLLCTCSSKPAPSKTAFLTPEPAAAVTLSFDAGAKTISIHFQGNGLVPKATYRILLRRGTCLKPGSVLTRFATMTADSAGVFDGSLSSSSRFPRGIPEGTSIDLRILNRGSETLPKIPTGCTDVPPKNPTSVLRLFPAPTMRSGGSFTATFKDARTLSLRFSLVALRPGRHDIRIYSGSCGSQGAVDTSFGDIVANASGAASLTITVRLSSSTGPLYVAVSWGDSRLVNAGAAVDRQFILCGDLPGRPQKK